MMKFTVITVFVFLVLVSLFAFSKKENTNHIQIIYKSFSKNRNMVAYVYDMESSQKAEHTRNISILTVSKIPTNKGNVFYFHINETNNKNFVPQITWTSEDELLFNNNHGNHRIAKINPKDGSVYITDTID